MSYISQTCTMAEHGADKPETEGCEGMAWVRTARARLEALRERPSRPSEAVLRISESLDFDTVLQGVPDSARSPTVARYGVTALPDGEGMVENLLSSGLTAWEELSWLCPCSSPCSNLLHRSCRSR